MNADLNNYSLIRLSTLAEKTGINVHCIRNHVDQGLIQVSDRTGEEAHCLLKYDGKE